MKKKINEHKVGSIEKKILAYNLRLIINEDYIVLYRSNYKLFGLIGLS